MSADIAGEVLRRGLPGRQAGDPEDRDGGADLHLLVAAGAFGGLADGAGGVALDQEHLRGTGEPQIGGGVEHPQGAPLAPSVAALLGLMGDRHRGPVQGVDAGEQGGRVLLDRHHVVRQQLLGDHAGVRAHGVPGVHREHAPADAADPGREAAQQRRELRHLVGLGPDQPFGDHRRLPVGGRRQQVRDLPVGADRAAHRLAIHRDRGQHRSGRRSGRPHTRPPPARRDGHRPRRPGVARPAARTPAPRCRDAAGWRGPPGRGGTPTRPAPPDQRWRPSR